MVFNSWWKLKINNFAAIDFLYSAHSEKSKPVTWKEVAVHYYYQV